MNTVLDLVPEAVALALGEWLAAQGEPAYRNLGWSCGPEPCADELHRQGRCARLRHSEEARDGVVMIPLFHGMTQAEQDQVLSALESLRP